MEKISLTFGLVAITAFSFMPEKEPVTPVPVSPHSAESLVYYPLPMQDTVPIVKQDKSVSERSKDKRVVEVPKPRNADQWATEKRESGKADTWATEKRKPGKGDTWATEKRKPGKDDTWATEKRKPGKGDTWATEKRKPGKGDKSATEKRKPGKADKWAKEKREPGKADEWAPKKKAPSTDSVQFPKPAAFKKDKKSSLAVAEAEANVMPYKQMIEAAPERKIEKNKLLAMADNKISAWGDKTPKKKTAPTQKKPATENIKKEKAVQQEGSKFFDEYLPEALRQKKPGKDGC